MDKEDVRYIPFWNIFSVVRSVTWLRTMDQQTLTAQVKGLQEITRMFASLNISSKRVVYSSSKFLVSACTHGNLGLLETDSLVLGTPNWLPGSQYELPGRRSRMLSIHSFILLLIHLLIISHSLCSLFPECLHGVQQFYYRKVNLNLF